MGDLFVRLDVGVAGREREGFKLRGGVAPRPTATRARRGGGGVRSIRRRRLVRSAPVWRDVRAVGAAPHRRVRTATWRGAVRVPGARRGVRALRYSPAGSRRRRPYVGVWYRGTTVRDRYEIKRDRLYCFTR